MLGQTDNGGQTDRQTDRQRCSGTQRCSNGQTMVRFVCWSVRHCSLSADQSDTAVCLLISQTLRFVCWSVRHSAVCLLISQTQCGFIYWSDRQTAVQLVEGNTLTTQENNHRQPTCVFFGQDNCSGPWSHADLGERGTLRTVRVWADSDKSWPSLRPPGLMCTDKLNCGEAETVLHSGRSRA